MSDFVRSTGWTSLEIAAVVPDASAGVLRRQATMRSFVAAGVRLARSVGRPDVLMLGHLSEPMRALARRVRPARVVAIDDGTASLVSFAQRDRDLRTHQIVTVPRRLVKCAVYGARPGHLRNVTVFTVFDGLPLLAGDTPIVHDFSYVRSGRRNEVDNRMLVVGTPAVSRRMLTARSYRRLLAELLSQKECSVVYRPHRTERREDLACVPDRWVVERDDLPLEVRLARDPAPSRIVGWFSTGLIGAQLIVGDTVDVCHLVAPESSIAARWRPIVQSTQRALRDVGVRPLFDE